MAPPRKPKPFSRIPPSEGSAGAPNDAIADFQDPVERAVAETTYGAAEAPSVVAEMLETNFAHIEQLPEPAGARVGETLSETKAAVGLSASKPQEKPAPLAPDYKAVANGVQAIQTLTLDALRENMEANLAFMTAFAQVKTLSEAVALQSAHARKQYDAVSAQWRNLASAAQRLAFEGAAPIAPAASDRLGRAA